MQPTLSGLILASLVLVSVSSAQEAEPRQLRRVFEAGATQRFELSHVVQTRDAEGEVLTEFEMELSLDCEVSEVGEEGAEISIRVLRVGGSMADAEGLQMFSSDRPESFPEGCRPLLAFLKPEIRLRLAADPAQLPSTSLSGDEGIGDDLPEGIQPLSLYAVMTVPMLPPEPVSEGSVWQLPAAGEGVATASYELRRLSDELAVIGMTMTAGESDPGGRSGVARWCCDLRGGFTERGTIGVRRARAEGEGEITERIRVLRAPATASERARARLVQSRVSMELCDALEREAAHRHDLLGPLLSREIPDAGTAGAAVAAIDAQREALEEQFDGYLIDELLSELSAIEEDLAWEASDRGRFILAGNVYLEPLLAEIRKDSRFAGVSPGMQVEQEGLMIVGKVAGAEELAALRALVEGYTEAQPCEWPIEWRVKTATD